MSIWELLKGVPWQAVVSVLFLTAIGCTGAIALFLWHIDKNNDFNIRQALVDSVTNKVSIEKIGFMVALATASWMVVHLTLVDKLSEWALFAYLSVFGAARVASQGISVAKDILKPKDPVSPDDQKRNQ